MKIFIYPNLNKLHAYDCTKEVCRILTGLGAGVCMLDEHRTHFPELSTAEFGTVESLLPQCDSMVVIGGDGTILKCSKLAILYDKAILGVNCGRLGFMASVEYDDLTLISKLVSGDYSIEKRMMLDAQISRNGVRETIGTALNDVVLSKSSHCKIADFEVALKNQVVSSLRADGLIFSTPTGASAYSLSAGGPLIEPDIECIEFTQICPHSLFARSMIFAPTRTISISFTTSNCSCVTVTIDGKEVAELSEGEKLYIKRSQSSVKIIDLNSESFYKSINSKLMRPIKDLSENKANI